MSTNHPPAPFLTTKLYRPPVTENYVPRTDLEARLDSGKGLSMTVVSAPAGYGKTTLISHWLNVCQCSFAWLSLDESDSDLRVFLLYLVSSIRTQVPNACSVTLALLEGDALPPVHDVAVFLANDLNELEDPLILVLDDYHRITEPTIHLLLDSLLEHPPQGLHMVIVSRNDPPLSLARFRARHLLTEIRMRDLEFSSEETRTFFKKAVNEELNSELIQQFQDTVEGWPVGVRLAALALQSRGDAERILQRFGADTRPLKQYLVAEVLAGLPDAIRDRLLYTSILKRFNGSLCEKVWDAGLSVGPGDGKKFIRTLEDYGLFCVALDEQNDWYRYHHLFAELLNQELMQHQSGDEISRLHVRAAEWFQENGDYEEAIRHALAASDEVAAAQIVQATRHELMNRENWRQLERWLNLFPEQSVESQPELLLLRCWLELFHWYRLDLLVRDVDRADGLITSTPNNDAEMAVLQAEVASLKTALGYWTLDPVGVIDLSTQVLAITPPEHQCVQDATLMHRVGVHQMLDELPQAEQLLWEYMDDNHSRTPGSLCRLVQSLCFVYWRNGDTRKLLQSTARLMQISTENNQIWSISFVHYFFGLVHYERNEIDEAISQLEVVFSDPYRYPIQNITHCALLLSLCYQAKSMPDRAMEITRSIAKLTLERGNRLFIGLVRAFQAEMDVRQGRIAQAAQWASEFEKQRPPPHAMQRHFNAELTLAKLYMARGDEDSLESCEALLNSLHDTLDRTHHNRLLIDVLGLKALLADLRGNTDAAIEPLQRAVLLAQAGRLIRPLADLGPGLVKLLNLLKLEGESLYFAGTLLAALKSSEDSPQPLSGIQDLLEPLSERELDVLRLFAENLSNKEVGEKLFISPGTVKRHAHNIYGKLAVNRRKDAVQKALGLGLIKS